MDSIKELQKRAINFRDARDWRQFHTPKDLAISLSLEAGELLEHFQWRNNEECNAHIVSKHEEIAGEMADVLIYLLTMAHDFDVDLGQATLKKLEYNSERYDVKQAKGNHKKYTEFKK